MLAVKEYIDITFHLEKDGTEWTAECLGLGEVVHGDTMKEVFKAVSDSTLPCLKDLEECGMVKDLCGPFDKDDYRANRE